MRNVLLTVIAALVLTGCSFHIGIGSGSGPDCAEKGIRVTGVGTGETETEASKNTYADAREKLAQMGLPGHILIPITQGPTKIYTVSGGYAAEQPFRAVPQ